MMKKRFLSLFLAVLMFATAFSVSAMPVVAAENNAVQDKKAYIDTSDFSIKGTNSVGNMLATEMENVAKNTQGTGNVIYSVEIDSNIAYAELSTTVACTLFVGIYTEDMSKLLVNKYTEVGIDDKNVILEFEEELPQYFYIKAFLIDTDDFTPVSSVYANAMYTAEMQELLASTTEDYNADRVINFDDDITNNFAVLSENVNIINSESDKNLLTYADIESDIYIFENIDSKISLLKSGDTISCKYNGVDVIIKVGEISIDGTTASIIGEDTELDEVFDYVKMNGYTGIDNNTVDPDSCSEGITFDGYENPQSPKKMLKAVNTDFSAGLDAKFTFNIVQRGDDDLNVTLAGNIKVKISFSAKLYISLKYQYIELKIDYNLSGSISVTGKYEKKSIPIAFFTFGIPGVKAEFKPKLVFIASGSLECSGTLLKGTVGYGWYSDVGGVSLNSAPKAEAEVKVNVTVFIGFCIDPEIKIGEGFIADAKVEANLGAEISASYSKNTSDATSTSSIHDCKNCIKGEVYVKFDLSVKGKLLNNKKWSISFKCVEVKRKSFDFYYSFDYKEFNFTTCPHIKYKLTVNVTTESGIPIKNAMIDIHDRCAYTDNKGSAFDYFRNGNYTITVSADNYVFEEKNITLKDAPKTVNIILTNLRKAETPDSISSGGMNNAVITKNGDLYMLGYGDFINFFHYQYPELVMQNVKSADLGLDHNGAITENGDLYMWGNNDEGQLGDGTTIDRNEPTLVMHNVKSFSLGDFHSGAITKNGDLYVWGCNGRNRLGDGTNTDSIKPKLLMHDVKSISFGGSHSAAITEDGDLYMWGGNEHGQLGDGTTQNRSVPTFIMHNVKSVSLGEEHSAAITENGDLYMWGIGALGNGTNKVCSTPTFIMHNVKSVSLTTGNSAAITADGDLYMWGNNEYGQLGDGTTQNRSVPTFIMHNVKSVSLGVGDSAAITQNGELYRWGLIYLTHYNWYFVNKPLKIDIFESIDVYTDLASSLFSLTKTSVKLYAAAPQSESTFTDLLPDTVYNFYIMSSKDAANPFESSNLYYIDQGRTDENGNITFSYAPESKFASAQKFVTAYENRLPDSLYDNLFITSDRANIYLHINENALSGSGYENIRVKFEIDGVSETVTESIISEDTNVFAYSLQSKKSGKYTVNIRLLADCANELYLSKNIIEKCTVIEPEIRSITIGNEITKISSEAFDGLNNLKEVNILGNPEFADGAIPDGYTGVIKAFSGTNAQNYCTKNGVGFESLEEYKIKGYQKNLFEEGSYRIVSQMRWAEYYEKAGYDIVATLDNGTKRKISIDIKTVYKSISGKNEKGELITVFTPEDDCYASAIVFTGLPEMVGDEKIIFAFTPYVYNKYSKEKIVLDTEYLVYTKDGFAKYIPEPVQQILVLSDKTSDREAVTWEKFN